MTQITIQLKDKEEQTFVETFLEKMKISFDKSEIENFDFEVTDEMKAVLDKALKEDKSKAVDAWESLKKIRSKHGV